MIFGARTLDPPLRCRTAHHDEDSLGPTGRDVGDLDGDGTRDLVFGRLRIVLGPITPAGTLAPLRSPYIAPCTDGPRRDEPR